MAHRIEKDDEELFGHLRDNEKPKARKVFIVKLTAIHDYWRLKKAKSRALTLAKKNVDQVEDRKTQKLEDKFVTKKGGQSEQIVKELIKKQADKSFDEGQDEEEKPQEEEGQPLTE